MGVLRVVWLGGIRPGHKNWLTEFTSTQEVQARLASFPFSRLRALSLKV
jgi:hypothetical protein